MADDKQNNGTGPPLPKQALFLKDLLRENGITEYEPQVINLLLEFTYSYITERLTDAQDYANHAGRANIALEDVKLAVLRKSEECSTTVLSRDTLMEIAREKNSVNLPALKTFSGPRLPPDRYCLASHNYRLKDESITPKLGGSSSMKGHSGFVDPSTVMSSSSNTKKDFVNPQMIMPSSAVKRKWQDEDDYD